MKNFLEWGLCSMSWWIAAVRSAFDNLLSKGCYLIFASLGLAAISGCNSGYEIVPAIVNIANATDDAKVKLVEYLSSNLKNEGFNDFGKDKEMIALFEKGNASDDVKKFQLARLNREHHFIHADSRLRVVLADYVTSEIPTDFPYSPASKHFIEIRIYEERPNGFSLNGLQFYNRFVSRLQEHFGTSVVVIKEPVVSKERARG